MPHSAFLATARPRGIHPTRSGPVSLPILYREATVLSAVFRVPSERVAAELGDLRLEPLRFAGKTPVALTIFEYRDTTIGPYNELAITSYVRPIDDRRFGAAALWVHALPVTTANACDAGLDIWGLPKWVTPIDCVRQGALISGGLPGELSLELTIGRSLPFPVHSPIPTFSELGGDLIRTRVPSRSRMRLVRSGNARLRIEGAGRASDLLERLGCLETRPSFGFWCDRFESILPPGKKIGAARRVAGDPPAAAPPHIKAS